MFIQHTIPQPQPQEEQPNQSYAQSHSMAVLQDPAREGTGRRMDADGSIVYRWNHTFRIQEETDKVEPTVYADTRIPYTAFPCGSERFRVYMIFQGFPGFSRVIPGLSRVILGGLSRVIYSYTGLSRVYTGFIQGYLGLFRTRG